MSFKFVVVVVAVIAGAIIGSYYRRLHHQGKEYHPLGPKVYAAVMIAITVWIMRSPP